MKSDKLQYKKYILSVYFICIFYLFIIYVSISNRYIYLPPDVCIKSYKAYKAEYTLKNQEI